MRFRTSPSPAAEHAKTRATEDLQNEYRLIDRSRALGDKSVGSIADQNDIARELERRGEI